MELLELVGEDGYAAARRTTINAHYTDPAIVAVIWQPVGELGFDGGRVLEPGCGIGTFIGLAPADAAMTGVVAALERVLPADLGPEEIAPRLGAAWIDADTHRRLVELDPHVTGQILRDTRSSAPRSKSRCPRAP